MAKVYGFVVLSVLMMLVMNLAGIPTGVNSILEWVGITSEGQDISNSQFFAAIAAIFATSALTGIIVGFFTRASPESFIAAGFTGLLTVFIGTFISVINYAEQTGDVFYNIILVVLAPITIGYGVSLVSYWRGADG